jgi:hypothetical protein
MIVIQKEDCVINYISNGDFICKLIQLSNFKSDTCFQPFQEIMKVNNNTIDNRMEKLSGKP